MDTPPEEIIALADQLSQVARDMASGASSADPKARKALSGNLVMQAKKLIWAVQEPIDAMTDQVTTVC
jgi:hypothetical protein